MRAQRQQAAEGRCAARGRCRRCRSGGRSTGACRRGSGAWAPRCRRRGSTPSCGRARPPSPRQEPHVRVEDQDEALPRLAQPAVDAARVPQVPVVDEKPRLGELARDDLGAPVGGRVVDDEDLSHAPPPREARRGIRG